jgi:hypothetical protein
MSQEKKSNQEEFQCDLCDASFDSISELEEHKAIYHHTSGRPSPTENREYQRDIGAAGLPTSSEV